MTILGYILDIVNLESSFLGNRPNTGSFPLPRAGALQWVCLPKTHLSSLQSESYMENHFALLWFPCSPILTFFSDASPRTPLCPAVRPPITFQATVLKLLLRNFSEERLSPSHYPPLVGRLPGQGSHPDVAFLSET